MFMDGDLMDLSRHVWLSLMARVQVHRLLSLI